MRTWFYLDDILAWYPEFNRSRTAIYGQFGILPGQDNGRLKLPASTGIRGELPTGAAGALDLLAVAGPPESRPRVRQLSNPGQQDAFSYGSAFSRGALIRQPDVSLIQVSGTAAIDEQGRSLYPDDVRAQIDCTFDKIAALIGQEGASLTDIAAACVFVKRPEDALVYQERAAARGLANLPAVIMVADVCREELLFEMDAEVAFDPALQGCSDGGGLMGKRNRQGKHEQCKSRGSSSQTTWICQMGITVLLTIGVITAVAFFLLHGKQTGAQSPSPPVTKESVATPETKAGFDRLKGRWLRPDGGYVLEIAEIDVGGKMIARYFNPRPINVSRAEAAQEGTTTKVFIELRDTNYPGSTYTLTYDPKERSAQGASIFRPPSSRATMWSLSG